MKARLRKRNLTDEMQVDELREVVSEKITNYMINHLSKQKKMKIQLLGG